MGIFPKSPPIIKDLENGDVEMDYNALNWKIIKVHVFHLFVRILFDSLVFLYIRSDNPNLHKVHDFILNVFICQLLLTTFAIMLIIRDNVKPPSRLRFVYLVIVRFCQVFLPVCVFYSVIISIKFNDEVLFLIAFLIDSVVDLHYVYLTGKEKEVYEGSIEGMRDLQKHIEFCEAVRFNAHGENDFLEKIHATKNLIKIIPETNNEKGGFDK